MKTAAICAAALMALAVGGQQQEPPAKNKAMLGSITLLPGYTCSPPTPADGFWTISKKDGVTIKYSGGNVANVVQSIVQDARRNGTALWTRDQEFEGRSAEVAMTKDGHLLVSIAPFNFSAKVESVELTVDALLMILTYGEEARK